MKIFFLLLISASFSVADVVLYDEPQISGYQLVAQWKPQAVYQIYHGTIETCSFPTDSSGNSLCYSGVACIEGTNTANNAGLGGDNRFSLMFENFGWIKPEEWTALVYHIRQKTSGAARMNIHPYGTVTSGVQVGAMARVANSSSEYYGLPLHPTYGPNALWYTVTIPMSAFQFPAGTIVNRFTWDIVNPSGWYIDQILLVGTGTIHYPNPYPPISQ